MYGKGIIQFYKNKRKLIKKYVPEVDIKSLNETILKAGKIDKTCMDSGILEDFEHEWDLEGFYRGLEFGKEIKVETYCFNYGFISDFYSKCSFVG